MIASLFGAAVEGILFGLGAIALLRLGRGERLVPVPREQRVPHTVAPETVVYAGFYDSHTTVETPLGLIVTGFRYCPAEMQTVAVIVHPDGSATCADAGCGAHIPTTQEGTL